MSKRFRALVTLVLAIVLCMSMSMNAFAASSTARTSGGSSGSVRVQFSAEAYRTGNDYVSVSQEIITDENLLINMYWDNLSAIKSNGGNYSVSNLDSATSVKSCSFYEALPGSAGTYLTTTSTQRAYSSAFGSASVTLGLAW